MVRRNQAAFSFVDFERTYVEAEIVGRAHPNSNQRIPTDFRIAMQHSACLECGHADFCLEVIPPPGQAFWIGVILSDSLLQKLAEVRKRKDDLDAEKRRLIAPVKQLLEDPIVDRRKEPWYSDFVRRMSEVEEKLRVVREEENNALLDILSDQSAQMNKALEASNQATEKLLTSSKRLGGLTAMLITITLLLLTATVITIFVQEAAIVSSPYAYIPLGVSVVALLFFYYVIRKLRASLRSVFG